MDTGGIFLSYRREDAGGQAGRLYDTLVQRFGPAAVFRDIDTIPPGADFVEHIEESIASADVILVVIGRDWVSATDDNGQRRLDQPDDYVRLELEMALRRDVPVIPVLVRDAAMPLRDQVPEDLVSLTRRQAIPLPDQHWDLAIGNLVRTLEGHLPSARQSPQTRGITTAFVSAEYLSGPSKTNEGYWYTFRIVKQVKTWLAGLAATCYPKTTKSKVSQRRGSKYYSPGKSPLFACLLRRSARLSDCGSSGMKGWITSTGSQALTSPRASKDSEHEPEQRDGASRGPALARCSVTTARGRVARPGRYEARRHRARALKGP